MAVSSLISDKAFFNNLKFSLSSVSARLTVMLLSPRLFIFSLFSSGVSKISTQVAPISVANFEKSISIESFWTTYLATSLSAKFLTVIW